MATTLLTAPPSNETVPPETSTAPFTCVSIKSAVPPVFVKLATEPPVAVKAPLFLRESNTFEFTSFAFTVFVNVIILSESESKLLLFETDAIVEEALFNTPSFATSCILASDTFNVAPLEMVVLPATTGSPC